MKYAVPIFLFFLSFIVLSRNIGKPFIGIHDWNGARYGNIARNYLKVAPSSSWFGQVEQFTPDGRSAQYYTHYPSGLPFLIYLSYLISGVSEYSTRLVPVIASSFGIVLLYLTGANLVNRLVGLIAGMLALATPMVRYFGKNPVHEPLAVAFSFITFLGIALILKNKRYGGSFIVLGLFLTSLINWSGIFLFLAVLVVLVLKRKLRIVPLALIATLAPIALHFRAVYILTGGFFGGGLWDAFLVRTATGQEQQISILDFFHRLYVWNTSLYTVTLLAFSLFGAYLVLRSNSRNLKIFIFCAFLYGFYALFFRNATYIHNYFIYYFLLFVSLTGAYGVYRLSVMVRLSYLFVLLGILSVVYFERLDFVNALEASNGDELAYRIGRAVRSRISSDSAVRVVPESFAISRLPHLLYYSDRYIVTNSQEGYNWIVTVDEDAAYFTLLRQ